MTMGGIQPDPATAGCCAKQVGRAAASNPYSKAHPKHKVWADAYHAEPQPQGPPLIEQLRNTGAKP